MIDLKLIKPNIFYRNPSTFYLPVNTKNPTKDSMYVVISKSSEDTVKFFADPKWKIKYGLTYFKDKHYSFKIYSHNIIKRYSDTDLRDYFKNNLHPLLPSLVSKINKMDINDRNLIYDVSEINKDFFEYDDSHVGIQRITEYFRLFKDEIINRIKDINYSNKSIFIPVEYWVKDVKDKTIFHTNKTDNFISLFANKLKTDYSYFSDNLFGYKLYFMYGNQVFMMIPEEFNKDTYKQFLQLFNKFHQIKEIEKTLTDEDKSEYTEIKNKSIVADHIEETLDPDDGVDIDTFNDMIDSSIEKSGIDIHSDNEIELSKNSIVTKKELELQVLMDKNNSMIPKSSLRSAREMQLVKNMKNLKMDDITLEEIQARVTSNELKEIELPIKVINPALKKMKFPNFDKAYLENKYHSDIVSMMTSLQYKDRPLYLMDIKVKDVSDALNELEEYSFMFEDENGRRHNFKIDLPKFIDDRFLKIGGNKKIMINQIIPIPITKTGPDTVQIATNYKKSFITRFGQNVSPKIVIFKKNIAAVSNKDVKVDIGQAKGNREFITTIEYDELSSKYKRIRLPEITFYFAQNEIRDVMKNMNLKLPDRTSNIIPIAITKDNKVISMDTTTGKVIDDKESEFIDYLVTKISKYEPSILNGINSIQKGKKYMYSRALIMKRRVPIILLLAYLEGLINIMKRANIKYRIMNKNGNITPKYDKGNEDIIEFEDAWLIYDIYPLRNILLLNGLAEVPTKLYKIEQFLTKDVYYELFDSLFGRSNIGYAFENFQQLFIDPVTEQALRDFNLPTDFIDVFLYANSLLEDNSYTDDGDQTYHRVRSNEMVTAFLYGVLSTAYGEYRLTADRPNPTRMTARKNSVIVKLLTNQVTKDYSDLNPLYTIDLMRSTTFKGPGGMNEDRSFNMSKRSFHPSMVGILSQASPISGSIGIARTLTVDPNVTSVRGYMKVSKTKEEINKLSTPNLVSGAEACLTFAVSSTEPERVAMASAQSRHTLATVGADRNLVYSGFEKALPHLIGNTFVRKAKKDGKVTKVDLINKFIIIKYNDNTNDVISIATEVGKNSGAGFFVANKLIPLVKEGDKVTAGKLVAHNPEFFEVDRRTGDSVFMHGPMARVAYRYSSKVFEDSTMIAKSLSDKMTSHIVIKEDIALGPNANITKVVDKGQEVKVNDPLLIFDISYNDDLTNKLLSKLNELDQDMVDEAARNLIVSKHNGVIEEIKLYYTGDLSEYSESIRKLIVKYQNKNKKLISDIKSSGIDIPETASLKAIEVEYVDPGETGKVKGVKVPNGGVLLEIYIKYKDVFSTGDKLASFEALKAIDCDEFPEGQEPYMLNEPENKIDMYLGVLSFGARMAFGVAKTGSLNSILIGMKKNILQMYREIYNEEP